VLVVGGSGGGLQETTAALLASRGFAALALAYFAYEDLPEQLANIPLEYFAAALDWMARHEAIRGDRLGVLGRSRGGELALLLGATFAQFGAVVGCVPSAVLWGALGMSGAAWTLGGEELPYVHDRLSGEQSAAIFAREPSAATPWYLANLEDPAACEAAAIPVERTRGPILLLSGEDDQMWPSTLMCEMLMGRLVAHGFPHRHEHLRYPGDGHLITAPYLPTTVNFQRHPVVGHTFTYGGAPREQARANADSWPRVLAFLRDSLQ
jgi:dienelactone hydrolase